MELIIDNRECTKNYFKEKNYNWIKCENLDLGDYIFKYKSEIVCIIERKTIEDMANSIKDGRYREQKSRLLENFPISKILYLIEGDLTKSNKSIKFNKVAKSTIYSSIINIYLRDNINVFCSNNESETIEFLEEFAKKLEKQGTSFLKKSNSRDNDLFNNMKSAKKTMTPELVYKLQLSAIPSISEKSASAIIEKYPSIKNLYNSLSQLTQEERIKTIKSIKYKVNQDKFRKISKKVAENLEKYMFS